MFAATAPATFVLCKTTFALGRAVTLVGIVDAHTGGIVDALAVAGIVDAVTVRVAGIVVSHAHIVAHIIAVVSDVGIVAFVAVMVVAIVVAVLVAIVVAIVVAIAVAIAARH